MGEIADGRFLQVIYYRRVLPPKGSIADGLYHRRVIRSADRRHGNPRSRLPLQDPARLVHPRFYKTFLDSYKDDGKAQITPAPNKTLHETYKY